MFMTVILKRGQKLTRVTGNKKCFTQHAFPFIFQGSIHACGEQYAAELKFTTLH